MRLDSFIAQSRVIDLKSTDFKSALAELVGLCKFPKSTKVNPSALVDELYEREHQMTTYLGNGVALPHTRIPMKRAFMIAVGRCPSGLTYDGRREYGEVRLVFLLLAAEGTRNYLYSLASLARVFQDKAMMERLLAPIPLTEFRKELKTIFGGEVGKRRRKHNRFNNLILREAATIAKGAHCSTVLVFGDTFGGGVDVGNSFKGFKTVLIAQAGTDGGSGNNNISDILPVRSFSNNRFSQLRSAVLIGLTRGVFSSHERLCCVGGLPQSNQFDSIIVVDIEREFHTMLTQKSNILPAGVLPEVVERVIGIATELAVEGREGHPVGCLFILGDAKAIGEYTKPLILNPFYGYQEEDRNILNPFMDETVKELSSIDGAFVVRGDGVLEAAGTLINTPAYQHKLPSGLGSRHAAAASISQAVDCLSIVVSGSTGQVTLFRSGEMFPLIDKAMSRNV